MDHEVVIASECERLLSKACAEDASDIYLTPKKDYYTIAFRKFGRISEPSKIPDSLATRIISYLKYLAALDISEKRKPQSGAFQQEVENDAYAFRISTLPSIFAKESIVVRILKQNFAHPLEDLCYHPQTAHTLAELVSHSQGLILLTGATGSGKTTTLYSLVQYCQHTLLRHVISLEDPVESSQENILQIQVNERAGITYSSGLKAILRHSPDVIMIGEIRDRETAKIALEAALTGHLVLSTIHAKDAVGCLYRLHDLGLSLEEIRQATIAIVGQLLVEVNETERRAIYEMLLGEQLEQAITAKNTGQVYALPTALSLTAYRNGAKP